MKSLRICLLACVVLATPLAAQMDLTAIPDPLSFAATAGAFDSQILTVANSGTATRQFSLLTQPPSLTASLVSYCPFDNQFTDLLTNWTGAVSGPQFSTDSEGHPLSVLSFDGVNDYYELWESNLANTFSVSFRAKPLRNQSMLAEGYLNAPRYTDYLLWPDWYNSSTEGGLGIALGKNGLMVIEHAANYMPVLLSYSADLTGWNSFAIVFADHIPKLFVNGVLVRTGIASPRQFTRLSSIMGGAVYGYFRGYVDDYSVYNTALTVEQAIAAHQFRDRASLWLEPRLGSLGAGQSAALPARLIDPNLPAGAHTELLTLCQMGSAPLLQPVTIMISQTGVQPIAPADITVALDGLGNALLHWSPVSPSPTVYKVYSGTEPYHPERHTYLGSTNSSSYLCIGGGEPEFLNRRFFSVVAYTD